MDAQDTSMQGQVLNFSSSAPSSPQQQQALHQQMLLLQQQQQQQSPQQAMSPEQQLRHLQAMMEHLNLQQQAAQQQFQQHLASKDEAIRQLQQSLAGLSAGASAQAQQQAPHVPAPAGSSLDIAALTQANAAVKMMKELPPFEGRASAMGLSAARWLQDVEYIFSTNEALLGIAGTARAEAMRLGTATSALTEEARQWHVSLTEQGKAPASWAAFKEAFQARFNGISSDWLRQQELEEWVRKESRDKMSLKQLGEFCQKFVERAAQLSDRFFPRHQKILLLAKGLPRGLRKWVLDQKTQENWEQSKSVDEIVQFVLLRASSDSFVKDGIYGARGANTGASSVAAGDSDMDISALQFEGRAHNWDSDEEEERYGSRSRAPAAAVLSLNAIKAQLDEIRQLAAMGSHSNRTAVAKSFAKQIPEPLAKARKTADLCIRCGAQWWVRGKDGHNARTCKELIDAKLTVAEGLQKARAKGPKPEKQNFQ